MLAHRDSLSMPLAVYASPHIPEYAFSLLLAFRCGRIQTYFPYYLYSSSDLILSSIQSSSFDKISFFSAASAATAAA